MRDSSHGVSGRAAQGRSGLEIADIFRDHGDTFRRRYSPTSEQRKVMWAIVACRTAALGYQFDICDHCGHVEFVYKSCRDRHCPKCQALPQAKWIEQRKQRCLPVPHYHVVFTLPDEGRSVAYVNRKMVLSAMLREAADTLLTFGRDPQWLGAQLGITMVLHTWTRDLRWHPHVHCIVTAGGLTPDGQHFRRAKGRRTGKQRRKDRKDKRRRQDFLFPVRALAKVFRAKMVDAVERARSAGNLTFAGGCSELANDGDFARFRRSLFAKRWHVYAKAPFRRAKLSGDNYFCRWRQLLLPVLAQPNKGKSGPAGRLPRVSGSRPHGWGPTAASLCCGPSRL